jgi:serine/threonine-protein kinase
MEYVDGETLFSRIHRRGPLPVEQALAVVAQVCAALGYLHERGVMHRDLKSANIKIASSGVVKLLDFGIAKRRRARGMTTVGTVVGTPECLAPEQIGGQTADLRSEIWAVGLLAYEMLSGRLPFSGHDEGELYNGIRNATPPPPSAFNSSTPPEVDALVMRCLEKRPSRRFQTTADVSRAIGNLQAPAEPAPAGRLRALPSRTKLWIAAAFVLLFAFWMWTEPSAPDDLYSVTIDVVEGTAEVYADGSRVGRTPYRTRGRSGETVRLELRRAGYLDQPVQFEVSERKTYSFTMQRASQ